MNTCFFFFFYFQELEEIHIDTCNTIKVAIESHALVLLTKVSYFHYLSFKRTLMIGRILGNGKSESNFPLFLISHIFLIITWAFE